MITIITGTPGAGKTAYAVQQLSALIASGNTRPVFVVGIPGLQLPHELAPPPDEWVTTAHDSATGVAFERWAFPDGSLVIVDEAQTVYRPRSASSRVPPHVAALERHRHQGLDFWLITQSPNLLDSNVRRLGGKHIHLRGTWAGRKLLEWPEVTDPTSRAERTAAVARSYKLPKSVFGLYQSASVHVVQSRRLPVRLFVVLFAALAVIAGGSYIARSLYFRTHPESAAASAIDVSDGSVAVVGSGLGVPAHAGSVLRPSDFIPRIRNRPESAPLYDADRKVHQIPRVAGCVATADRCTCYTQQGTDAFLDVDVCREWLVHRPFDPFTAPVESQPARAVPDAEVSRGRGEVHPVSARRVRFIPDSDRLAASTPSISNEVGPGRFVPRSSPDVELSSGSPGGGDSSAGGGGPLHR